jgi:hypothetical protein
LSCARPRRRSCTASVRARQRSRMASSQASGTFTAVSSPARCNRANFTASRGSVFTRSPDLFGMSDGATTVQWIPSCANLRAMTAEPTGGGETDCCGATARRVRELRRRPNQRRSAQPHSRRAARLPDGHCGSGTWSSPACSGNWKQSRSGALHRCFQRSRSRRFARGRRGRRRVVVFSWCACVVMAPHW